MFYCLELWVHKFLFKNFQNPKIEYCSMADNEIIRYLKIIPFDREKNSGFNHIRIISFTVT